MIWSKLDSFRNCSFWLSFKFALFIHKENFLGVNVPCTATIQGWVFIGVWGWTFFCIPSPLPLNRIHSKSLESLHNGHPSPNDSGRGSHITVSPVVEGLENDIVHLVDLVMDIKSMLFGLSTQVTNLEVKNNKVQEDFAVLLSGVAEGVGTVKRTNSDLMEKFNLLREQQEVVVGSVHELGAISIRSFFRLPVTSGKQMRCSYCGLSVTKLCYKLQMSYRLEVCTI